MTYEEALVIASRLKEDIKGRTGLPCSIGVGTNKLISKMACEAAKPGGVKVIKRRGREGIPFEKTYWRPLRRRKEDEGEA